MNRYHYATVPLHALIAISRVPLNKDAYVADDTESRALNDLINSGYRLHSISHDNGAAIFEKRCANERSSNDELVAALDAMYKSYGYLHDMLSDCVESGRLSAAELPDDYMAIANQLERCVGASETAKAAIAKGTTE